MSESSRLRILRFACVMMAVLVVLAHPAIIGSVSAAGDGEFTIDVEHENGDQADEVNSVIIYQRGEGKIKELGGPGPGNKVSLKHTFSDLPTGNEYKVTAYIQDQFVGETDWVPITQDTFDTPNDESSVSRTLTAENPVEVTVRAYHEDGSTPLADAEMTIESHDPGDWRKGTTGENGYARTSANNTDFSLYPTNESNYTIEISDGGEQVASEQINTLDGNRDIEITTDVPVHELDVDTEDGETVELSSSGATRSLDREYPGGATVELTVNPDSDRQFAGGEGEIGNVSDDNNSIVVRMSKSREITATFAKETHEIQGHSQSVTQTNTPTIVSVDVNSGERTKVNLQPDPDAPAEIGPSVDRATPPEGGSIPSIQQLGPEKKRNISKKGNTDSYPWSAIGAIATDSEDGGTIKKCTGTVVGSRDNSTIVLTAAHCIYDTTKNEWQRGYTPDASKRDDTANPIFIPGYSGKKTPYGKYDITNVYLYDQWLKQNTNEPSRGSDIAFLVLNESITDQTGSFGYSSPSDDPTSSIHVTGYPSIANATFVSSVNQLWDLGADHHNFRNEQQQHGTHRYDTNEGNDLDPEETAPGSSGGPVWQNDTAKGPTILSVHAAVGGTLNLDDFGGSEKSTGALITDLKAADISELIQRRTKSSSPPSISIAEVRKAPDGKVNITVEIQHAENFPRKYKFQYKFPQITSLYSDDLKEKPIKPKEISNIGKFGEIKTIRFEEDDETRINVSLPDPTESQFSDIDFPSAYVLTVRSLSGPSSATQEIDLDTPTEADEGSGDPIQVDVAPSDLPGDGTQTNPYQISNASELQAMEDDLDANYELVSDIDASKTAQFNNGSGFNPVGGAPPFTGTFAGINNTITGLTISRPNNSDVGLFGVTGSSATLTNVGLANVTVTGNENVGGVVGLNDDGTIQTATASGSVSGDRRVGGLVGGNGGTITDASASGSVTGGTSVGGLVGDNDEGGLIADRNGGTITDASASGSVTGQENVGGLVGDNSGKGTITDATASGSVTGQENVGGLAGDNSGEPHGGGIIKNATASGSVTGQENVGGLVGRNLGRIIDASASGSVNGSEDVGGLVGFSQGTIQTVSTTGSVTGDTSVGGLVGENDDDGGDGPESIDTGVVSISGRITDATASGGVNGSEDVGGLIGNNFGTVIDATASGSVTGVRNVGGVVGNNLGTIPPVFEEGIYDGKETALAGTIRETLAVGTVSGNAAVGGLVGNNSAPGTTTTGTVEDSYFDEQATGQSTSAGSATGLTTAQIQGSAAESNMGGFDFQTTWMTASGYPTLRVLSGDGPTQVDVAPSDLPGDGTQTNPYEISNASELQAMDDDLDSNYELVSNIDASNTAQFNNGLGFDPVGGRTSAATTFLPFTGSLDGNDHTITGLTINRPTVENVGLVGVTGSQATIRDITLANMAVTGIGDGSIDRADGSVGGLVGTNNGKITDAVAAGSVTGIGATVPLGGSAGGLVGTNNGKITDSTASGSVTGIGRRIVGGLVGANTGTIRNATASGSVTGNDSAVGGLVGANSEKGTITDATASGSVSGEIDAGGLVGRNLGTITDAVAAGSVKSLLFNTGGVGGLVGPNTGTIRNATASGNVTGVRLVGGLVGANDGNVTTATASGSVTGERVVGGLVGFNRGPIQNATASGSVSGDRRVGGLVGSNRGNLTDSSASGSVTGTNFVGGLVGANPGTVQNATASGSVDGDSLVGGFVGGNDGTITIARASGSVTGERVVGGLVGANTGTIRNAIGFGSVTADENVGGLVGGNDGTIQTATASGSVTGSGNVGGIVGSNRGNLTDSSASGSVTGTNFVGGLVGANPGTVQNATASGSVDGDSLVGGFVGGNDGTITIARASGSVTGERVVGGLVGANTGTIRNAIGFGSVTADENVGGLVGGNDGTIQTATASGSVTGSGNVGGIVGENGGTVQNARASGSVDGDFEVGGLVGTNNGKITDSTASGNVTGGFDIGGLVGLNRGGQIQNTTVSVSVNGTENVGGVIGRNKGGTIRTATASGSVTGEVEVGGLAGDNSGNLTDSSASGRVNGTEYVGGLVGRNSENSRRPDAGITNATASGSVSGDSFVGGLVGDNNRGTVQNARASGSVTGEDDVGGLIGTNGGTITDATASGSVSGDSFVGGLVGDNNRGTVQNATATGNVTGRTSVGGLAGINRDTVRNATASGSVSGDSFVGGLVGDNSGNLTDSSASGTVTATGREFGSSNAGGLAGINRGTIRNATASGSVTGEDDVGGLVGTNGNPFSSGTIKNASASGSVTGIDIVGGLVGDNPGEIRDTFAVGAVSATGESGSSNVGGLVGNNDGTVRQSYFDTQATNQTTSAGTATGLTTDEMQGSAAENNMGGFDFGVAWETQTDPDDYPTLIALLQDADQSQSQPEPVPPASVTFENQTVSNGSTSVTVGSATFNGSETFNLVVHQARDDNADGTIQAGEIGTKIGESIEFDTGTRTNITVNISKQVDLDDDVAQLTENQTLVAMLHTTNTTDNDNIVHTAPISRNGTPVFDQADITVTARVSVEGRDNLQFGQVNATPDGDSTVTGNLTLSNPGEQPIGLTNIRITGTDTDQFELSIDSETDSVSVSGGAKRNITVEFTPTQRDELSAVLTVSTNTTQTPEVSAVLNGTGIAPELIISNQTVSVGAVSVDAQQKQTEQVTIQNDGNTGLRITVPANDPETPFSTNQSTEIITIASVGQESLQISFDPSARGVFQEQLTLTTNSSFTPSVTIGLSGTGSQGALSVQPRAVEFGELTLGESKQARVLVTNPGTAPVTVTPELTDSPNFTTTLDQLGANLTLTAGESEFLSVSVEQTSRGDNNATIEIGTDSDDVQNRTIALNTTPLAPDAVAPDGTNLSFGDVSVNSTAVEAIPINNTGTGPLRINRSASADPDPDSAFDLFAAGESTDTDIVVAPGDQETVPVRFTPQEAGESNVTVKLVTNDPTFGEDGNETFTLNGTGVESDLAVTDSIVEFDTRGTSSTQTRTVTIRNDGGDELTGLTATLSGTNDEQFELPLSGIESSIPGDGGTTNLSITYEPTSAGSHSAQVILTTSSDSTSASVSIAGRATPPDVNDLPGRLQFGFIPVSDGSTTETVAVKNLGANATQLTVIDTTVSDTGNFTITDSPSGAITGTDPNTDEIEIELTPQQPGPVAATLTVETTDPDTDEQTQNITLTGTGAVPDIQLNRSTIELGEVPTGTTSSSIVVGVTNNGTAELNSDNVAVSINGPFTASEVTQEQDTIVPGGTAPVSINVTPSTAQTPPTSLSEDLNVTFDGRTRTATINATGIQPEVTADQDLPREFGDVPTGSSATTRLTVRNTGNETLQLSNITASGSAFNIVGSQQQVNLTTGDSTTIGVSFSPSTTDDASGTFTLDTNDPTNSTVTRSLSGTGTDANASLSTPINFGEIPVGESEAQSVTLTNTGNASLTVTDISPIAGSFSIDNANSTVQQGETLGGGEIETIAVEATPQARGSATATININTTTTGPTAGTETETETVTATLGAVGTEPAISVQPISLGETRLGETSTEQIEIVNTGNAPLTVSNVTIDSPTGQEAFSLGSQFEQAVIVSGGTETVPIEFAPPLTDVAAGKGSRDNREQTANITLKSNDPDGNGEVNVAATGVAQTAELDVQSSLKFVEANTTKSLRIRNDITATANLTLTESSVIGADSPVFSLTDSVPTELAPGETTEVNVTFNPQQQDSGRQVASLSLLTNDPREAGKEVFISNTDYTASQRFGSIIIDFTEIEQSALPVLERSTNPDLARNGGRITQVNPAPGGTENFFIEYGGNQNPSSAPAISQIGVGKIRYINVRSNITGTSNQFVNTSLGFNIQDTTLQSQPNAEKGDVELYQFNGSGYESLETSEITDLGDSVSFEAIYTEPEAELLAAVNVPGLVSIDPNRTAINPGQPVRIDARVQNDGASSDTVEIELLRERDGKLLDNSTLTVGAQSESTAGLVTTVTETTTLSVRGPAPTRSRTIDVADPTLESANIVTRSEDVTTEDSVVVNATVRNPGDTDGVMPLTLNTDGRPIDAITVDVGDGETVTAQLTASPPLSEGTQTLSVTSSLGAGTQGQTQSTDAGTITVQPLAGAADDDDDDDDDNDDDGVQQASELATETKSVSGQEVSFTELATQNDQVRAVELEFNSPPSQEVTTDVLTAPPAETGYSTTRATPVSTVDITVPESVEDDPATVTISVNREQVQDVRVAPQDLQVERFTGSRYQPLQTDVVSVDSAEVTLRAETPGFSVFVVSAPTATATATAAATTATTTPTATATATPPTPTPTPPPTTPAPASPSSSPQPTPPTGTPSGIPGFGVIALLTVAILIRYRRRE